MPSLGQSRYAPPHSYGRQSNMLAEFATSDEELRHHLQTCQWLSGREWEFPVWTKDVPEVVADPTHITRKRRTALQISDVAHTPEERRYLRNKAVIGQIRDDLNDSNVEIKKREIASITREVPLSQSYDAKDETKRVGKRARRREREATRVHEDLQRDASSLVTGDRQSLQTQSVVIDLTSPEPETATSNPEAEGVVSNPEGEDAAPNRAVESQVFTYPSGETFQFPSVGPIRRDHVREAEHAEHLKQTVLAPFYQRLRADSDTITRLRDDNTALTTAVENQKASVARLEQELQQPLELEEGEIDEDHGGRRGCKRKRAVSPPSPMQLGDVTNGNNDYTSEAHLNHLANAISEDLNETAPSETIHLCGLASLKIMAQRPDEVLALAQQKLHTWPYQGVPLCWRRLYEDASLSKAVCILQERAQVVSNGGKRQRLGEDDRSIRRPGDNRQNDSQWLDNIVKTLDMGITFTGAPGRSELFEAVFQQLDNHAADVTIAGFARRFSTIQPKRLQVDHAIPWVAKPVSFETFQNHLDSSATPLIMKGMLDQWPASQQWQDPAYLLRMTLGGRRWVPVEIGKSYTDEQWTQKFMSFKDFMETYLLPKEPKEIGYLAQHDLFSQIPALKADIMIPDYCYTSPPAAHQAVAHQTAGLKSAPRLNEPLLNAWLGPKGTKSPLHTDPYHNILCQVVGYKYVRLYPPSETPKLYPRGVDVANGVSMENTSEVDVSHSRPRVLGGTTNLDAVREIGRRFPLFGEAKFMEAVLAPGQCLYVPLGWWHYIESLTVSFSVSFWWN